MKQRLPILFNILLSLFIAGCREEILHDLSETDANRVMAELDYAKIPSQKVREADSKWSVSVEEGESARALRELNDRRALPVIRAVTGSKALIPSREDELLRHERQLSSGIEDTLKNISGVLEARVHLNLPKARDLFEPRSKQEAGTGAVLLVVDGSFTAIDSDVINLVASASGVARDGITVVVSRTISGYRAVGPITENEGIAVLSAFTKEKIALGILFFMAASVGGWIVARRLRRRRAYLTPTLTQVQL